MKPDAKSKTYRWMRIKHPERHFWGVPERMPWPVECEMITDRTVGYQAGDMREGLRRLRAEGGNEWTEEWAVLEEFCDFEANGVRRQKRKSITKITHNEPKKFSVLSPDSISPVSLSSDPGSAGSAQLK